MLDPKWQLCLVVFNLNFIQIKCYNAPKFNVVSIVLLNLKKMRVLISFRLMKTFKLIDSLSETFRMTNLVINLNEVISTN